MELKNASRVYYPLTHAQKRIWYIEKIHSNTSIHNIGGTVRIKGAVNIDTLNHAINLFIQKNEAIRLQIVEEHEDVRQFVMPYTRQELEFFDFSQKEHPELACEQWIEKLMTEPFKLEESPLYYFAIYKVREDLYGYVVKFHHIISDGWSFLIMTEQISDLYTKLEKGDLISSTIEPSYLDYIDREKHYLTSKRFNKSKDFWLAQFSELPDLLFDKSSDNTKGNRKTFELNEKLSNYIREYSQRHECSINAFFVALMFVYLSKYTQKRDIVIGTPVLNRSGKIERSMIGMFTSTMPFRMVLEESWCFSELMEKVQKQLVKCYFHQKYPYDLLVQDLQLKRKGYNHLFQVCVNYYNTKLHNDFAGIPVENVEVYNGHQFYSLQLVIKEWGDTGKITLHFDYKTDDYQDEQIEGMYQHFCLLMDQIFQNDGITKAADLTLVSEQEKDWLLFGLNNTKKKYPNSLPIHRLFEEQVKKTPDHIALIHEDEELTYIELNRRANQLAHTLSKHGVKANRLVGIMMSHSTEMIVAILAVLKAGGAYVPIDPKYPVERVKYIIEDSDISILIVNSTFYHEIGFSGQIIHMKEDEWQCGEVHDLELCNEVSDLAYVIYTSGSTGKPKGTLVHHQGLINYVWWAKQQYIMDQQEVFALYSSLAFDFTVTTIFPPLINGNTIRIYQEDENEFILFRILRENHVHVIKLTPAHLILLQEKHNLQGSKIKRIIVGGEDLKVNLAKRTYELFQGQIDIFNEYGPTETVVGCMIHQYDYETDTGVSVPIGRPIDNMQIYVLDEQLQPVPIGVHGEIYISGDGIAKGYLNQPQLTNQRFLDHPYIPGKKLYRTGDLAKYTHNGNIEYIGRIDHQVKIRGYRVELGEIEHHLLNFPGIQQAVVIDQQESGGQRSLCAYIVGAEETNSSEIRRYLAGLLPTYMIPSDFVYLQEIPLTPNGKVDRKALPKPDKGKRGRSDHVTSHCNDTQKKLMEVYQHVLAVDQIGLDDDFYDLGGDSIKAIQITSKLRQQGFHVKTKDITEYSTIRELSYQLESVQNALPVISQAPSEGKLDLNPIMAWFFEQNFAQDHYWHQSVLLKLKKRLDPTMINRILSILVRYHDSLRLNYDRESKTLYYNPEHLKIEDILQVYDLSTLPLEDQNKQMKEIAVQFKSNFDLSNDLLFKACLFQMGMDREPYLLLVAHHLVVDVISWQILLTDFVDVYEQLQQKKDVNLLKTHSMQKWSEALRQASQPDEMEVQRYWSQTVEHSYEFPIDMNRGDDLLKDSLTLSQELSTEETSTLLTTANTAYGTEAHELMVMALVRTMMNISKQKEVVIELEGHGREYLSDQIDISRTVGWFTSMYPLRMVVDHEDQSESIKSMKEQLRQVPQKGISYGVMKYLSRDLEHEQKKYVRFNYVGDLEQIFKHDLFELAWEDTGADVGPNNHMTALIDILAMVIDGKLRISVTFSQNKFYVETMERFINQYISELKELIKHCCDKNEVVLTPSDFGMVKLTQSELDSLFE